MLTHFQIEMLIYMAAQLSERTSGRLVDRAWAVLQDQYAFREELFALSSRSSLALAILVVRGWKAREMWIRETTGSTLPTPEYIVRLQRLVPSAETKQSQTRRNSSSEAPIEANATMTPATTMTMSTTTTTTTNRMVPQGIDLPWDQMLGFVDAGALDWDMFAGNSDNTGMNANSGAFETDFMSQQRNTWM